MRVCIVGAGGREHALAHALARFDHQVVVTPGNPGIAGSVPDVPGAIDADLFVIGPEGPLVDGLADELRAAGRLVFGPGAEGARIEGSKAWMKQLLVEAGVPTAAYGAFDEVESAIAFLRSLDGPRWVVKTDGLAAGKGVLVTSERAEAEADVRAKLSGERFGDAGRTVVIEEFLDGPEVSLLAVCDGHQAVALTPAQDHKRLGDGDTGPNTGGMGAFAPVPTVGADMVEEVMATAVRPTLERLAARGIEYRGVLYAGLVLTATGPKVLEYNARFGDPETQVVLPLLRSDLGQLLAEAAAGGLEHQPTFSTGAAVTVVCAAEGYPGRVRSGDRIDGLDRAAAVEGVTLGFAGVERDARGRLVTKGGRILDVTAVGPDLDRARARAYEAVGHISWPGRHIRTDIAQGA